jgi:hypothetical protein
VFRCPIDHRNSANRRNDLTGQAEFLARPADWRGLAAIPGGSKGTAGLAGCFRADNPHLPIAIGFRKELVEPC